MIRRMLLKQWFLIGIIVVILIAYINPELGCKGGPLKPEITVKIMAISIIFFNSGLSLRTEDLFEALMQVNVHSFIQVFTFLLVPVLIWALVTFLEMFDLDPWLLKGILVVGCMPPPVSSAVILTKAVGGNEAAAIFNSAFGSFMLGIASSVSLSDIILQLSLTVVLPLILGQIMRFLLRERLVLRNVPFGPISSAILLLIIYTTFCDTFLQPSSDVDTIDLVITIIIVLMLQVCLLIITFYLSTSLPMHFTRQDVVACLFCSTHKSLTLGIPILRVMFEGHPAISIVSIPLLIFHPTQILLGGILVPSVRLWMKSYSRSIPFYL